MLILHRITPFVIAFVVALGIAAPFWLPLPAFISLAVSLVAAGALLSRLGKWEFATARFWFFVGSPFLLIFSCDALVLFLESDVLKATIGLVTALLVFFFCEHLFTYLHLPAAYRVRAIEHASLVMNIVTFFFAVTSLYGFRLFLSAPLWALATACFIVALFLFSSTLWTCKVERARLLPYALGGAVLSTEMFSVLSYLPSGFFTNAALLSILFYLYLGLSRAFVLGKWSSAVLRRYVAISALLVTVVVGTATWE
jgi:hypothetical protein